LSARVSGRRSKHNPGHHESAQGVDPKKRSCRQESCEQPPSAARPVGRHDRSLLHLCKPRHSTGSMGIRKTITVTAPKLCCFAHRNGPVHLLQSLAGRRALAVSLNREHRVFQEWHHAD
jgi:hypothetical protein